MGDKFNWFKEFYFDEKRPILNSLDNYLKWIHNNELPELDCFCPDCNGQIFSNLTISKDLCYNCFRFFTKEEIIEINPNSRNCVYCKKKIMWHSEVCGTCNDKQYQLAKIIKPK